MDPVTTVLFLIVVFGFNFIQIIGAFAGTMLAMPFSLLLIGPERSRVVLNAVSILCCIYPIVRSRGKICWPEVRKITGFMLLGILAARGLGSALTSPLPLLLYSLLVIGVAVKNYTVKQELPLPKAADALLLLAAGFIHGAFLSGGSLLVIYAMRQLRDKDSFRVTLSVVWTFLNGSMLLISIAGHSFDRINLQLLFLAVLPAFAGILLGDRLQRRINQEKFRLFANGLLLLSGIVLLVNCLPRF